MRRFVLSVALLGAVTLTAGQSLTITPANPTIQIGQSIQLAGNGPHIQWSISDPGVATLTPSGQVTGRQVGKTIVFARARNGREGQTTVTVVEAPPPPPPSEVCGDGIDNDGDGLIDENPPCAPPPDPTTGRGPQSAIVCPQSAIAVSPGSSIQSAVNAAPAGATLCLKAGVHPISGSITPKSGMTFVGEYGAILDGTGWNLTSPDYQGAITAHGQDIDDVTIRNLVIRNMPQRGIHAYYQFSDRWTIEYNEITGCRSGVSLPNASILRKNYIHHNNGDSAGGFIPNGGYIASNIRDSLIEDNEIAFNGDIQKVLLTTNVTFRNNFVHHNGNGIWMDGDNVGSLIEGNRVEDNAGAGIFYEVSGQGIIRNNIVRRSGDQAIFISTSRDVQVYDNTLEDNWRGVMLFVSCGAMDEPPYPGMIQRDLTNNLVSNNVVKVGTQTWPIANGLSYGLCTAERAEPYLNGSKNNRFEGNRYQVPTSGSWWFWNGFKTFSQWQSLGHDATGTVSQ